MSALVDGDNGLGQVVMTLAAETAMPRHGVGHGVGGHGPFQSRRRCRVYTTMAVRADLIAIYIAVASANVMPPWGGGTDARDQPDLDRHPSGRRRPRSFSTSPPP